jgi:aryl-alcohol dehydrogenase-like predicted oxidoreductase
MSAEVEYRELAPGYRIPRVIRGGWQLAGDHGPVEKERAVADMALFIQAGLNTVDGADIYTGVEDMYGEFNARQSSAGRPRMQVHTKLVPDYGDLERVDAPYVSSVHCDACVRNVWTWCNSIGGITVFRVIWTLRLRCVICNARD